jgi:diaminopropionate ammonia-lyase
MFGEDELAAVREFFRRYRDYSATPLWRLSGLATELGVGELLVKDESDRFGLSSFKILGVSYAIDRLFNTGELRHDSIVACATDGNHGRALAHVATRNQLRSRIYIHKGTSSARIQAVKAEGAQVILVDGNYDDSVALAADDARKNGWIMVSDTAWPGYETVPRYIMAGYTMLVSEASEQWREPPDVVIVQAGVGGLACAVVSGLLQISQGNLPFMVTGEPESAACVLESMRAGTPAVVRGSLRTVMAGLSCGTVSSIAWPVLAHGLDACVAITDAECAEAVCSLSQPVSGDPSITAGESGACGLATLQAILRRDDLRSLREVSGLNSRSRVLLINTEGATGSEAHERMTGTRFIR